MGVQVGDCAFISAYLHAVRGEPDVVASSFTLSEIGLWLRKRRRLPVRKGKLRRVVVGLDANVQLPRCVEGVTGPECYESPSTEKWRQAQVEAVLDFCLAEGLVATNT